MFFSFRLVRPVQHLIHRCCRHQYGAWSHGRRDEKVGDMPVINTGHGPMEGGTKGRRHASDQYGAWSHGRRGEKVGDMPVINTGHGPMEGGAKR